MLASAAAITLTARLLQPLINDIYAGAKKMGARGLQRWEEKTFARKLARRLRIIEEVKTIWSPDKEVTIGSFYYPSKLIIEGKAQSINKLSDLEECNTLIEGTVGQGKSMLLRHLAIEEILSNEAKRIPIFLELRALGGKLNLEQAILKVLSTFDIDIDDVTLAYLYKSGKIALLLDGYDEVDEEIEKQTFQDIEYLAQKYPELLIIATSRPNNSIQRSTVFRITKIAPLTSQDYIPFITKLNVSTVQAASIKEAIRRSPSKLSTLITTPLMLTMVVIVYQSENEVPETLPEFFERLFHVVFTRHDKLKAPFDRKHYSGLSERKLQTLFEAFCFMCLENGYSRSLASDQFAQAFDDAQQYVEYCNCEAENFKLDITRVSCLMLEEGLDVTTFLHKSILEYYAAAFIKHSSDEVATLFYTEVLSDSRRWWEVLTFLRDIDPYRFSRYFALPEADLITNYLRYDPNDENGNGVAAVIRKMFPNLKVSLMQPPDAPESLVPRSYGPFNPFEYLGLKRTEDYVMEAIDRSLPLKITPTNVFEIFEIVERQTDSKTDFYSVSIQTLMKKLGDKEFRSAIEKTRSNIEKQREEANRIILQQEKRKRIFTRKSLDTNAATGQ